MYCENAAPGETERTCREAGPAPALSRRRGAAAFGNPTSARKKYYARAMKGNMARDEFNTWVEHAAAERDFTMELLLNARSESERAEIAERLRQGLNEK